MKNKSFQQDCKIIANTKISKDHFKIIIQSSQIAEIAKPGQFVEVMVSNGCDPLLRRPFGIHRLRGNNIEILYKVVGKGTEALAKKRAGEYLDVIGPLGNGFNLTPNTNNLTPIIVAGGMGVAPLLFLAEKLAYSVERIAYRKDKGFQLSAKRYPLNAIVLIGAKTKSQLLCEEEFRQLGCDVKISTDDGSKGFKGKVTELLVKVLASSFKLQASSHKIKKPVACNLQPAAVIFTCGPKPMLKETAVLSVRYKVPVQVSLEEHIACGIGVCLGCVVNTKEGFKRVCKEGPVFNGDEIIW